MNYLHFLPRINLKILKLLQLESRKAKRLLYNLTSPKWPAWGVRAANYLRRQLILLFLSGRANMASELRDLTLNSPSCCWPLNLNGPPKDNIRK